MADEMTTELAPTTTTELVPDLPSVSDDIVVLARDPNEMAEAQQGLIAWMDRRITSLKVELSEAEENLATAARMKHRKEPWMRVVSRVKKRMVYYEKAKAALEEGFCIIPDMPMEVIAVRTNRSKPNSRRIRGNVGSIPDVNSAQIPAGEGEYVSPRPEVDVWNDSEGKLVSRARGFQEVDFPFKVVKPQILKGMEEALKRKLFDEIGIVTGMPRTAYSPSVDPILVGRIKQREGYNERMMTFLIAWWIDTRSL
jgi:hypothetical protein